MWCVRHGSSHRILIFGGFSLRRSFVVCLGLFFDLKTADFVLNDVKSYTEILKKVNIYTNCLAGCKTFLTFATAY